MGMEVGINDLFGVFPGLIAFQNIIDDAQKHMVPFIKKGFGAGVTQ